MDENPESGKISKFTFEEQQRLSGFFLTLLAVDKRLNPEFYQPKNSKKDESNHSGEGV